METLIKYEIGAPDTNGEIATSSITVAHRVPSNAVRASLRPIFEANTAKVTAIKDAFNENLELLKAKLGDKFDTSDTEVGQLMADYAQELFDQVFEFNWLIFDAILDRSQLTTQQKQLIESYDFRVNCDFEAVRSFVDSFRKRSQI